MAETSTLATSTRHCKILVVPGALSLDVVGPLDVFTMAARAWAHRHAWDETSRNRSCAPVDDTGARAQPEIYEVELVSLRGGLVESSSSVPLFTGRASRDLTERFDTLIVAGGTPAGIDAGMQSGELKAEILRLAALARRVTSVCTGAFLLAAAGLLRGRRATTHWASCDAFRSSARRSTRAMATSTRRLVLRPDHRARR